MFYKTSIKRLADFKKIPNLAIDNKTNNSHYEKFKV
jgi:hypothetical protein